MSAPAPGSAPDLDRTLVRGLAWTGGIRWAVQVFAWVSSLVVARLLSPADYGLMGMAMVYLAFVRMLSELGLGSAIIQRRGLGRGQVAQLGGLSIAAGFAFLAVSAALAGPIAAFFQEPRVRLIALVLSTTFVIASLQVVPRGLLMRELRFRTVAVIDGMDALAAAAVAPVLAFAGAGVWALVFGQICGLLASTVAALWIRPHPLAWPRRPREIASEIEFGGRIVLSRMAWYVYRNADFVIIGRLLGKHALGAYTLGWNLADQPVQRISGLVGRISPGLFAQVQTDRGALQRYTIGLSSGIALLTFPVAIGTALVADPFVPLVLGEKWLPAVPALQLLAVAALIRSLTGIFANVLVATDNTRLQLRFSGTAAVVLPLAFLAGSEWGVRGVAATWVLVYPLVASSLLVRDALRVIGLAPVRYLQALWPAASSALAMSAVVLLVQRSLAPAVDSDAARLGAEIAAGGAAYPACLWLFHRAHIRRFLRVVRRPSAVTEPAPEEEPLSSERPR